MAEVSLNKEDQEFIDKVVEKDKATEGEYELEIFLSSDGKHTVRMVAKTTKGRQKGLGVQMLVYEFITGKYKTKLGGLNDTPKGNELKLVCPYHGKELAKSKYGGYYCSSKRADGQYCSYKTDDLGKPKETKRV